MLKPKPGTWFLLSWMLLCQICVAQTSTKKKVVSQSDLPRFTYPMGWPLTGREYGGAWIYGGKGDIVSLGFVIGLNYPDPRLDPQHVLQKFKQHPFVAKLLEGGKMIRYGAKSMPYGGWWSIPPVAGNGWMIIGDSAGFLNSQRLKGIHLAIKSGMLAAETAFEALQKDDFSSATLSQFQARVENSWIRQELWKVRNFHQGFEHVRREQSVGDSRTMEKTRARGGDTRLCFISDSLRPAETLLRRSRTG